MTATAFGHPLEILRDGVTAFARDEQWSMPLASMRVEVAIAAGLAVTTTTRTFRNREAHSIEAVITFPVAFDAVVTSLQAQVDGRTLRAKARDRSAAREEYEGAVTRGKLAVLHEEALKGVHVLSIGNLGPGREVSVIVEAISTLTDLGSTALLRIPTTVGELYGKSPLMPADDLVTGPQALTAATVIASVDAGRIVLDGFGAMTGEARVPLDRPIVLRVEGQSYGERTGVDATGRAVRLTLHSAGGGDAPLDCAVLFDRSGSTADKSGPGGLSVWAAMKEGLVEMASRLRPEDQVALWQFDSSCQKLGNGSGTRSLTSLLGRLGAPNGGTELGAAIEAVVREGARDVVVLTDGQTHASEVHEAAKRGCRISAVLVGPGSLDAGVGHLAAMTGGDVVWAHAGEVGGALARLVQGLRQQGRSTSGEIAGDRPLAINACRSGVAIEARWTTPGDDLCVGPDVVGRYVAALALPLMEEHLAGVFAAAHGLCSHLTSLVLVDEAGDTQAHLPEMRKVDLMQRLGSASFKPSADVQASMPAFSAFQELRVYPAPPRAGAQPMTRPNPGQLPKHQLEKLDWATIGPAIARGEIDAVPADVLDRLGPASLDPAVIHLAATLGLEPMIVMLALLAHVQAVKDRHARRVAARLLGSVPADLFQGATDVLTGHLNA